LSVKPAHWVTVPRAAEIVKGTPLGATHMLLPSNPEVRAKGIEPKPVQYSLDLFLSIGC
jgi:hypothetical protein